MTFSFRAAFLFLALFALRPYLSVSADFAEVSAKKLMAYMNRVNLPPAGLLGSSEDLVEDILSSIRRSC